MLYPVCKFLENQYYINKNLLQTPTSNNLLIDNDVPVIESKADIIKDDKVNENNMDYYR